METSVRSPLTLLGLVLLATLPARASRGGDLAPPHWNAQAAAGYLDGRADWWLKWSGAARGQGTACLSCHTSLPYALARPALGAQIGETRAGTVEQKLIDVLKKRVENWDKIVTTSDSESDPFVSFYSGTRRPSSLGTEAVLNALVLVNNDARHARGTLSPTTKDALTHLWEEQQENGAWLWLDFGLNPWESDASYYGACLAAIAVGMAGQSYYERPELQPKIGMLRTYVNANYADQPLHHRVLALWASSWLPGLMSDRDKKALIQELLDAQETDGGWSLPRLGQALRGDSDWTSQGVYPEAVVSDGYATGLVVLALKRAGVGPNHPQLQNGLGWLVSNQKDGAWPARYLNKKRDPQTDVGKFMRDAATAFAVLALAEAERPGSQ